MDTRKLWEHGLSVLNSYAGLKIIIGVEQMVLVMLEICQLEMYIQKFHLLGRSPSLDKNS